MLRTKYFIAYNDIILYHKTFLYNIILSNYGGIQISMEVSSD